MFKLCFKNTLTNTFDLFSMKLFKRDIKKKNDVKLKLKQTRYSL